MPLFLSTYVNKIDAKGRISVPASFRAAISSEAFKGLVLFRSSFCKCLEGFAMSKMEELSGRLNNLDLFSSEHDDLASIIFGDALQAQIDVDGRINLPEVYKTFACLDDKAAFVGMGHKFQIWNPELLEKRNESARENIASKGVGLPGRSSS